MGADIFWRRAKQGGNFLAHGVIRIYSAQHPAAALGARACLKITPGWEKAAGHFFKFLVLRARTYLGAVFFLFTIVE
jgi:hypothetical protein